MKKTLLLLSCGLLLLMGSLRAQNTIPLPNSSFEQWYQHQGYSITVFFTEMPIYDTFSMPMGWEPLNYPVNETMSIMGMPLSINTNLPLIKVNRETGVVPDGSSAVKLQTIKIEDIINSTVYALASSSLDPTLVQTIFPSVLATAELNVEALMPFITSSLTSNLDALLDTLLSADASNYISGGLPLNGLKPATLTGSYKYHSAVSGDNGGVFMLGTRYDSVNHRRQVVGGGFNLALTDIAEYAPFQVDYMPLTVPAIAPDTLVVVIASSVSTNMQQGSYLCVDNLQLFTAPDTCSDVVGLSVENQVVDAFPEMVLSWGSNAPVVHWEVEYGPQGFTPGNGTLEVTTTPSFEIYPLEISGVLLPDTWYDFYVRSVCDDGIYGDYDSVHYHTSCASVSNLTVHGSGDELAVNANNMIEGYTVSWTDTYSDSWTVYYGIYDSRFPDNWGIAVSVDTPFFQLPPLQPGKLYTVAVTADCGPDVGGRTSLVEFRTISLSSIADADDVALSVTPNPANGRCQVFTDGLPATLKLFSLDGRLLQEVTTDGTPVTLTLSLKGLCLLQATTIKGTTTRILLNQ